MDIWTWILILLTAGVYGTCLAAAGTVLFRLAMHGLPRREWSLEVADGPRLAAAGLALVLLALAARVLFLGGGDPATLGEWAMWRFVLAGPVGESAGLRILGLGLTCAPALLRRPRWRPTAGLAAVCGLAAIILSFTVSGHATTPGMSLLAPLLGLHLAAAAFWIGALWPLFRLAGSLPPRNAAAVMQRFGQVATMAVGLLLMAGLAMAIELVGSVQALFATGYGRILLAKLALVAALLGLAAGNRWRHVPALRAEAPGAARRLRLSILAEIGLVALILLATAALVTLEAAPATLGH
ncbi:CopD family protein [Marinibaculum pumilum]|uniref:CopD family protein n=1 Tax=Marinibaculum pumilum TaxID=1766165 RepID=A0ABV7KWM7_9PROT